MTGSMIERAAKAILAKVPLGYGMTKDEAIIYARAAIEAMKNPTQEMIEALFAELVDPDSLRDDDYLKELIKEAWGYGIDAALEEK